MNCPYCQIAYDPEHWESCPHCGGADTPGEMPEQEHAVPNVWRTSTILIAVGDRAQQVYRSVGEVPEPLRRQLVKSTNSANSGTIYIADRGGQEQITKALRRLPERGGVPVPAMARLAAGPALQAAKPGRRWPVSSLWFSLMLAGFAGAVIWLAGSRSW